MSTRHVLLLALLAAEMTLGAATARATTAGPVTELAASNANVGQRAPSIAFDGTRYFIVWEDGRSTTSGIDIYFARLDASGALQDPMGVPLLTPPVPEDQTEPSIVYCSTFATLLVVWTDPRNANLDTYAARIIPGSGTVQPSSGLQLTTSAPDAETAPHAACSPVLTGAWSAVFQSTLAGTTKVQAIRLEPDLSYRDQNPFDLSTGGATESKPRVVGLGTNFIVTWEDTRNSQTTGLDIYGRIVPDFGPVTPVAGTQLATGLFGQQKPDSALIGPSTLALVWEDDRLGAGVDRNLWRNLYNPANLNALAIGEGPVSLGPADQQRPRIAADTSSAMIIWQDFRDGPVGIIYGSRMDGSGNVRDPNGFPVFAFNQNAFEHAITKGPNNDYLATAVRFDNAAPRIFYRIIRDEVPAGTMNATGTLTVPADGTTAASITFGPARGVSNTFDVVDGTLYTVTLSRADVTINVVDADPLTPGFQVRSVSGSITFGLTSLEHGSVTVTLESVEGTATGSGTVIFENVPPTVSNVVLAPASPTSNQDLTLSYSYNDINGDLENGTQIEWLRNAAIQGTYTNMLTVPASATVRGDQWRARVTPRDGLNSGMFVFSNTVIIGNTPPSVIALRIDPDVDVKTGTGLRARYTFEDADNDAEAGSTIRWYDHGAEVAAYRNLDRIPGADVIKGQEWSFSVLPADGTEPGLLATSATVVVGNTIPVANAGMNLRGLERRSFMLDGRLSSDVDPQDTLQYQWSMATGMPAVSLSDTSSATPSFIAPSIRTTVIYTFDLIVTDGEGDSIADTVTVEVNPVRDTDGDGLDDEEEAIYGTDPQLADTDRDGLNDAEEIAIGTKPRDEDTDEDGVRDGAEGRTCPMCEVMPTLDSDGDGILDPLEIDSDGDGIIDGVELSVVTAPSDTSTAGPFMPDADRDTFTNPTVADTDQDTLLDGVEDANQNGRLDPGESDPNNPADPPRACTPNGNECPPTTVCENGTCVVPAVIDGGLICRALDPMIECCMGGCTGGTLVEPVCNTQGALEQCVVGAQQCVVGSCSGPGAMNPGGDSGCGCTASGSSSAKSEVWFVLLAIVLAARRRRG